MKLTHLFLFCFVLSSACTLAKAAEVHVEVVDNEDNCTVGTMTALDSTQIVVEVQGTLQTISLDKLVKIRNVSPNPYGEHPSTITSNQNPAQQMPLEPLPTGRRIEARKFADTLEKIQSNEQAAKKSFPSNAVALELKDGSRLVASSFTVEKNQGVFRLLNLQNDVALPLQNISAVRFSARNFPDIINPPADWLRLAVPNATGDRLIVGNPGSFDVYAGILQEISAETISFAVDGEVLPVPRRKVFGLVLHAESLPTNAPSIGILTLWSGTRGMISDIQLSDNELTWKTTSGLTVTVLPEMLHEIDFGEKRTAYLADFEFVRNEFSLPFESEIKPAQFPLLQKFYENRMKNSPSEVVLDGKVYKRSIPLRGKTLLEYPLPKPFSLLKAVIGIEDQYRPYASATLQILADSQVLGTWELRGDTASQRIHLNLPQHCRLITIIAEPTPQSSVPAVLTIADPKLFE